MTIWETRWLKRLREYWNDKKLAEKCGLEVKDICVHEWDGFDYFDHGIRVTDFMHIVCTERGYFKKCKKCGEFYK